MSAGLETAWEVVPGYEFFRRMLLRMLKMAAAWALIGIPVGVSNGIHVGGGTLNLVTQTVAGVVVFSMQGFILGILFNGPRASILGSAIGMFAALIATLAGAQIEGACMASVGLAAGGMFGATLCPLARLVIPSIRRVKATLQAAYERYREERRTASPQR